MVPMSGVPDVRDSGGRLKRIVIALAVSIGCAVAAYFVAGAIVASREGPAAAHVSYRQMDGGQFQLWVTGATFAVAMFLSFGVLESIAKKKYLASLK